MTNEIELLSDDDGIALIGHPRALERLLAAEGLGSIGLQMKRLAPVAGTGAALAQGAASLASESGRWVKLTEQSANLAKHARPMGGDQALGAVRGVVVDDHGKIANLLQFTRPALSPAMLGGVAGLMAQLAMQQQMDQIAEYLAVIDEKVDDLLRAQKDAALADVLGVQLVIEEALIIRDRVGRVSDVTWSKVQGTALAIARAQGYAMRQLDALAEKLERKAGSDELLDAARDAEAMVQEWLAVVAQTVRLQEAAAVLELDRVFESAPDDLDRHREGLRAARRHRSEQIERAVALLIDRIDEVAGRADARMLLNPLNSPAVIRAARAALHRIELFSEALGITVEGREIESRRWRAAAGDARDSALARGADGIDLSRRLGAAGLGRARAITNRVASGVEQRTRAAVQKTE